jgi:hypothetical protein
VRVEVFTAVKIQVEVFWVLKPCSVVLGYQLQLHHEDAGSMDLRDVGILPQHYTASEPRRHGLGLQKLYVYFMCQV